MQGNKTYLEGWEDGSDWIDSEQESPQPSRTNLNVSPPTATAAALPAAATRGFSKADSSCIELPRTPLVDLVIERPSGPLFPCWKFPEHFPAFLSRSGLFSVERLARSGHAPYFSGEIMAAGARLSVHGPRLSMNDKELFCELASRAKREKLSVDALLVVPISELAHALGWSSRSDCALQWIFDSALRLTQAQIQCKPANAAFFQGAMLLSAEKTRDGLAVRFDSSFVAGAFGQGNQFLIDRARRRQLNKPLSRWLHDYLSTHTKREPADLAYLRGLCGYLPLPLDMDEANAKRKQFPRLLRSAAEELGEVAPGLIGSLDLVTKKRSSANWTATFTAGTEKAKFEDAQKHAPPASATRRANL